MGELPTKSSINSPNNGPSEAYHSSVVSISGMKKMNKTKDRLGGKMNKEEIKMNKQML